MVSGGSPYHGTFLSWLEYYSGLYLAPCMHGHTHRLNSTTLTTHYIYRVEHFKNGHVETSHFNCILSQTQTEERLSHSLEVKRYR